MDYILLLNVVLAIALLLILILKLKVQPFLALLISSIAIGIFTGMPFNDIVGNIKDGMAGTLGFVATIVGIGAIFGAVLEHTGSTQKIANYLLKLTGINRAPVALLLAGFCIAIPVFFDVAFVILVPLIYALQKESGKSLLYYAIPLLAGLAITHAFIPPTPGPIAVADILKANLGLIIFYGFIVGIPTAIVAGLIFGKYIGNKIHVEVPKIDAAEMNSEIPESKSSVWLILSIIFIPILLILGNTFSTLFVKNGQIELSKTVEFIQFIGHPFSALIIGTLLAMYILGSQNGLSLEKIRDLSTKSLGPAGIIILITGAGGVFKQMLIQSGAGKMIAELFMDYNLMPLIMAFLLAGIIRILQGSATVAMITAAGLMASVLSQMDISEDALALIVLSIAAGASTFSHVNDSGFWLVNKYLGLTEVQTFKSWTMMTGILSITALLVLLVLNVFVS